ncbi:acyltransferase [Chitinophaga pendula]|uniref:acyltransferase n=1 Tax=Chitinophaga TaxID=79328 RepID=UPI000BAEB965|nr:MULTISPECIES: acyltransferase [Chitinophaga]ASZ12391.1 acetyltransferase [Chitinophaga sp. MD30]UCJ10011.1 acyltransferase [Chitinophaga pendula]
MNTIINIIVSILKVLPAGLSVFFYDCIKPYSQKPFLLFRYCICKRLLGSLGQQVIIGPNVTIKHWKSIHIGTGVSIHDYSYMDGYGTIRIGNDVSIAHNCTLISSSHTWNNQSLPIRKNPVARQAITIEPNVWLGCDVRVMGGVTISKDVIVGAGSVVTKSLDTNGIFFGSPAAFYKPLYSRVNQEYHEA